MTYGADPHPLALAHRGGAGLGPENTLHTFARSTALGLRYLETDVVTTRDGVPVCFHDRTLQRLAGDPTAIADLTAREVARIRLDGEPIPTLAEALHAFPDVRFSVDLKDLCAVGATVDLLRANPGWASRVCVAGAWDSWLARATDAVPGLTRAMGWRSLTTLITCGKAWAPTPRRFADAPFAHVPVRMGRFPVYAARLVREAHRVGVRVIVWTVDEPALMHSLLDAGVDGIITDHPDRLREVLIARGEWEPLSPSSAPAVASATAPGGSSRAGRRSARRTP